MLPGTELLACHDLAVPREVMEHVVRVESSFNPYAIGVVGGRLARQPRNLPEALATARMLEREGYNFSLGLAQVNRHNLARYGLDTYARAFEPCPNLQAGARILADCHRRARGHWGKAFSCYYSGDFVTGYRHGYVQKVFASMRRPVRPVAMRNGAAATDAGRKRMATAASSHTGGLTLAPATAVAVPTASLAGAADQATPPPSRPVSAAAADVPEPGADAAFVF